MNFFFNNSGNFLGTPTYTFTVLCFTFPCVFRLKKSIFTGTPSQRKSGCALISGFHRSVNQVFTLLGCYAG